MSSPSRTNDLQAAHWPSLQPCMSMIPCSAAPRRTVCSSSISTSTPTGSKRTRCFSAITTSGLGLRETGGPKASLRPSRRADYRALLRLMSVVSRSWPTGRALLDVVGVEGVALLLRPLVEQHVRALNRRHAAQVVQLPHLLRVQVQVRLGGHGLAVVADEAHVADHVGPVPAVVEGLPLALADELAHVRGLATLVGRPERRRVRPVAKLGAVGPNLPVDLVHDHVLADQTRDHAGPAPVRVHV